LGCGKRVRGFVLTGVFAWVETGSIAVSSDIKKSSRLIVKSADARCWKKIEKIIPDWPCPCEAEGEYFRQ